MFDFRPPEGPTAFVFPGQGSQAAAMLEAFRESPRFTEHVGYVGDLLGRDPLALAAGDPEPRNRNVESSLLTVLASVLCLDLVRQAAPDDEDGCLFRASVDRVIAIACRSLVQNSYPVRGRIAHDDAGIDILIPHTLQGLDTVQALHVQIEQDQIGRAHV